MQPRALPCIKDLFECRLYRMIPVVGYELASSLWVEVKIWGKGNPALNHGLFG
jgi:hypothetical protein